MYERMKVFQVIISTPNCDNHSLESFTIYWKIKVMIEIIMIVFIIIIEKS